MVPTIVLGPGQPEMAHQTDEYCYIQKLEQAVDIYKDIILKWGNPEMNIWPDRNNRQLIFLRMYIPENLKEILNFGFLSVFLITLESAASLV